MKTQDGGQAEIRLKAVTKDSATVIGRAASSVNNASSAANAVDYVEVSSRTNSSNRSDRRSGDSRTSSRGILYAKSNERGHCPQIQATCVMRAVEHAHGRTCAILRDKVTSRRDSLHTKDEL